MAESPNSFEIQVVPKVDWMPLLESVPGLIEIIAQMRFDEYQRGRSEPHEGLYIPFTEAWVSTAREALQEALNGRK